jgi:NAD+ kinase
VQSYFIFANPYKPETVTVASKLLHTLQEYNVNVYLEPWLYSKINLGQALRFEDISCDITSIISLGGDGTLLRIVPKAAECDVPILGINLGHIGFLMEAEVQQLSDVAKRLISGDFEIEKRMLLEAEINKDKKYLLLNDIAFMRGNNPSSIVVSVLADDEKIFDIHGDGVLISTPTGTTGYGISAGGPVISPRLDCIAVIPVCSHVLHQRPVVLPDSQIIYINAKYPPFGRSYQVVIDGQISLEIEENVDISIKRAKEMVSFIRFSKQRFLTRLHEKQMEWNVN